MKTLPDLINEHVDHLKSLRYSASTQYRAKWCLRHFTVWLKASYGLEAVERLLPEHLRKWHQHITARRTMDGHPLAAKTINNYIEHIRCWLKRLAKGGYLNQSLLDWVPYVRKSKLLPGSVLTHSQMRKLLVGIPTNTQYGYRDRAMLEVLYSSGIRAGELLGLNLEDVDFKNRAMKVRGKGDKERIVPIGRTAARYLDSYIIAVRPFLVRDRAERALFLNQHGYRLLYCRFHTAVRGYMQKDGMDIHVTPHTFRRSCATELIRNGANMYHVKELLGHESLDTLKHYAKLTINDLKKTHEKCHPRERDEEREGR